MGVMAYSKRVYITKVEWKNHPVIGSYQVPYIAGLPLGESPNDPYELDFIWSSDGDDDGSGIFSSAIVAVYTTDENHAILENDPDITRIDDL